MAEIELNSVSDASAEAILQSNFLIEEIEELNQETFGIDEQLDTPAEVEEAVEQLGLNIIVPPNPASATVVNDVIFRTEGDDVIPGTEQGEEIFAGGGNDLVDGDPGGNSISDDTIDGGSGDDIIIGQGGNDSLIGGSGNDFLFGDANINIDTPDAPRGKDTLFGGDGNDFLFGGNGEDSLDGNLGNDVVFGGNDNDTLKGAEGEDRLFGGNGSDLLFGSFGNDTLFGEDGEDNFYGGSGNDLLYGDRLNDIAGGSADNISGDEGNDTLIGGVESDWLDGGDDDDRLSGVDPSAQVDFGFSTIDTLTGGNGSDTFVLGSKDAVFYDGGIPGNPGTGDYAIINDFQIDADTLELNGSLGNYSFGASPSGLTTGAGLGIFLGQEESGNELIAVLKGVSVESIEAVKTTIDFV